MAPIAQQAWLVGIRDSNQPFGQASLKLLSESMPVEVRYSAGLGMVPHDMTALAEKP